MIIRYMTEVAIIRRFREFIESQSNEFLLNFLEENVGISLDLKEKQTSRYKAIANDPIMDQLPIADIQYVASVKINSYELAKQLSNFLGTLSASELAKFIKKWLQLKRADVIVTVPGRTYLNEGMTLKLHIPNDSLFRIMFDEG